jgi:ribosomal protein L17
MNNRDHFLIASSIMLLAIFFCFNSAFAQLPKLFLQYAEKHNSIKSGYVKLQQLQTFDNDTTIFEVHEIFFISTPKDLKYLVFVQKPRLYATYTYCKSALSLVTLFSRTDGNYSFYEFDGEMEDAKAQSFDFRYSAANDILPDDYNNCLFQRIAPKIDKKNIRYKITLPDQEEGLFSNINIELEFNRKTFNIIQEGLSFTFGKTEPMTNRIDILEQRLFEYIHPNILDTISFTFDKIKKGYDRKIAEEQAKIDSVFRDSIVNSISKNAGIWAEEIPQEVQKDTLFFMPEWKFPLLSGDTIYSDSINSQFLLIDMWYVACHPCRLAMHELASIDTLYEESLLKMLSINVYDKDTAKINNVIRNLNLKCDVALAYDNRYDIEMSKQMGNCYGYPQLYLIDMKTKQVIWHACGYYEGFTKDIGKIITSKYEE